MATQTLSSLVGEQMDKGDKRFSIRESRIEKLKEQVQEIMDKQIMMKVLGNLPPLDGNDQELVDATLSALSDLLQLTIIGDASLGKVIASIDLSPLETKNSASLAMSVMVVDNFDAKGIRWLRSLVKNQSLHTHIESLLLAFGEIGVGPQHPHKDSRIDAVEAGLLLSHSCELISLLSTVKTTPLRFDVKAPVS